MAEHKTSLMKIRVLGNDNEIILFRVLPYKRIISRF